MTPPNKHPICTLYGVCFPGNPPRGPHPGASSSPCYTTTQPFVWPWLHTLGFSQVLLNSLSGATSWALGAVTGLLRHGGQRHLPPPQGWIQLADLAWALACGCTSSFQVSSAPRGEQAYLASGKDNNEGKSTAEALKNWCLSALRGIEMKKVYDPFAEQVGI